MRRRAGFTLIELLVAISVIALMIAILLPALTKAREAAVRTKCLSGSRQVTVAALSYAASSREYVPTSSAWGSYTETLAVGGYTAGRDLFTKTGGCPYGPAAYSPQRDLNDYYSDGANPTTTYGLNGQLQAGHGMTRPYVPPYWVYHGQWRLSEKRPMRWVDQIVMAICLVVPWDENTAHYAPALHHTLGLPDAYLTAPAPGRHGGEVLPASFVDGHGDTIKKQEIQGYWNYPNNTRMYYAFNWKFMDPRLD
jgi:prepilin-type N-terminal cleavage/methylation domain-containing protein